MTGIEEDTELRDLVTQSLENNGLLGKIQAELRAGVFLALEETDKKNRKVHHNKRLHNFLSTSEGRLAAGIVQEFLEFFQLDYTAAVFEPESGLSGGYEGRVSLEKQVDCDVSDDLPLLSTILKQRGTGHNVHLRSNSPSLQEEQPAINDSMDFLSNRKPIDDMLNKYTQPPRKESPVSEQISEHISETLSEQQTEGSAVLSNKEWEDECKDLSKKLENIGIKTPTDKMYEEDFEVSVETEDVTSDIDDLLQTSGKGTTDKGGLTADDSMLTSDHTISVDSVGDADYVEDVTF